VGHLEHPARLEAFFVRLRALKDARARDDVRVLWFGDSHTASDYGVSVVRARLEARFGTGGRGFIPMGDPHKRLFQAGETMGRSVGFRAVELSANAPGRFGLTGMAAESRGAAGAQLHSEFSAKTERLDFAYLAQPGGGSADVVVDGKKLARFSTQKDEPTSGFTSVDVPRGPHDVDLRAVGDGPLRVFGVRLDDAAAGVTVEALGMNGAKAATLLASDEAHFAEQVAHAAPALAILAYGTNEAGDSTTTPDELEQNLRALAGRVTRAAPGTACLVLGPFDRGVPGVRGMPTLAKLAPLIAAERRAADAAGCAFFDQLGAMGGPGAMGKWATESPPRGRKDAVHLTRAGYAFLADALATDALAAYDAWQGAAALALVPPR
jgi:lysophospholipase L1-like esterase